MGRSLLETIIPHVLRKVDRVTYGLLQARDIAHADPNMPHSRTQVGGCVDEWVDGWMGDGWMSVTMVVPVDADTSFPILTHTHTRTRTHSPLTHTDRCAFRR